MGQQSINEAIRLYSAGMISRASLEEEIDARKHALGETERRTWLASLEDYIDLYPDSSGTWRAIN